VADLESLQPFAPGFKPVSRRAQAATWPPTTLVALAGLAVCAGAVAMVAASVPGNEAFGRGLVELLIIATPIAAGLYALQTGASRRLAFALVGVGFAWSLTALAESSDSVVYTVGRLATWLVFPCVVYLLLAFPAGRITSALDRTLFAGVLVVSAVLFYGTAPLVLAYPPHTLWAACTTGCPANAVALVDRPPAVLTKIVYLREWLVMVLWAGLFWSMFRRYRAASPLRRRTIAPVFAAAAVLGVLHISFHATRELGAPANLVVDLSSAWTLAIVGVCAAFLFGLFRRRVLLGRTLAGLGRALRASDSPAAVSDALAAAFGDPSVELLFHDRAAGSWHDAYGRERRWPRPLSPGRAATPMSIGGGPEEVVLVHDVALRDDEELLDGVNGLVMAGWRHERVASDLARATSDLASMRRRVAEAAVVERARIERDLHDGAQQRLVALRLRLAAAEEDIEADPAAAIAGIRELGLEVDRALEELRSLAHGVYPLVLTQLGLVAALRSLRVDRGNTLPVHVTSDGVTRHPPEVEGAVYFTCVEAVQNAMKHAAGATGIWIHLGQSRAELGFEVRDDGPGLPPEALRGQGMQNMHDRIESVGGRLTVESEPGSGTRVIGSVPLE